jgi:hypothetical protein
VSQAPDPEEFAERVKPATTPDATSDHEHRQPESGDEADGSADEERETGIDEVPEQPPSDPVGEG